MPMIQFSYPLWLDEDVTVRETMQKCLRLRKGFDDYIACLFKIASEEDKPIVRYMEYEYPNEGFETIVSQFMLGEKYIIAPITEKGQGEKTVYIPKNTKWRRLDNGATVENTQSFTVDINTLLIFEKL